MLAELNFKELDVRSLAFPGLTTVIILLLVKAVTALIAMVVLLNISVLRAKTGIIALLAMSPSGQFGAGSIA